MEISGYTYTFGGMIERVKVDHTRVINLYREMGIRKFEIYDTWIEDDREIPGIIDQLVESGMTVCVSDVECNVVSRDRDIRKARTEKFHKRLEVANEMGSPKVLILPGLPSPDSGFGVEECREWLNSAIEESIPVAKELGIMLMVANLGFCAHIYGQTDYIIETCQAFKPDIKTVYDVGNYLMANEDSIDALNKVYPYTTHVHLKDWEIVADEQPAAWPGIDGRLFMGKPMGKGIVKLPEVIKRLKELDYQGIITPEYEGPGDPYKAMEEGMAYLRTLL